MGQKVERDQIVGLDTGRHVGVGVDVAEVDTRARPAIKAHLSPGHGHLGRGLASVEGCSCTRGFWVGKLLDKSGEGSMVLVWLEHD